MVLTRSASILLLAVGLLLNCSCASVRPAAIPEYAYLGTYAGSIAAKDGALDSEERLIDEMAQGIGYWVAFKGVEALIQDRIDRPLLWWERILMWVLPIAINVKRIFDSNR